MDIWEGANRVSQKIHLKRRAEVDIWEGVATGVVWNENRGEGELTLTRQNSSKLRSISAVGARS